MKVIDADFIITIFSPHLTVLQFRLYGYRRLGDDKFFL